MFSSLGTVNEKVSSKYHVSFFWHCGPELRFLVNCYLKDDADTQDSESFRKDHPISK